MAKRVIIIHGWDETPASDWYEWLKDELEEHGIEVEVPEMPQTGNPQIKAWVEHLDETVKKADKDTYFVGHDIGCQAIMRYLETTPEKTKIGGVVLVAPWFTLMNLESKDKEMTAKPWIKTKIDLSKVKKSAREIVAFFSDNDPSLSAEDTKTFEKKLGAKMIIEKNQGHFTGEDGVHTPDTILEEVLKMMGNK